MNLISFSTDYNKKECSASFGLPFEFKGALCDLPREKDDKKVAIVGLTPYTIEKVIDIPFNLRTEADNICTNYYRDEPRMIEKLEQLTAKREANITEGPWYVKDGSYIDNDKRIGSIDILTEKDYISGAKWIGQVTPYGDHNKNFPDYEEAKVIANLFATAPDMFKAIQLALNIKDLWAPINDIGVEHEGEARALQSMLDALHTAYLKATGQPITPVTNQ